MDAIDLSIYEDDDIITDDSRTKSDRIQKFFENMDTKYKPDFIDSFGYTWRKRYGDGYYSLLSCKKGNSTKTPIKLQFTIRHGHSVEPIFTTCHDYSIKAITDKFNRDNPRQILDAMDESVRQLIFAMNNIKNTITIEQL